MKRRTASGIGSCTTVNSVITEITDERVEEVKRHGREDARHSDGYGPRTPAGAQTASSSCQPGTLERRRFCSKADFAGLLPLSILAVFAVVAYRRRVSLRWPFLGIALLSGLVSLANVSVRITGGASAGAIGAGLGFSPQSLPSQLVRVIVLTFLAFSPLWLASRLKRRTDRLN